MPRLLFCSYHCYWDQSSGAALCTRELLELLAQRGWSCRVFCGPHLDFEDAPSLAQILAAQQIPFERREMAAGCEPLSVFHFQHRGVPVQIYDSPVVRHLQAATREERTCFLALYERLLERFQPDLVLTYGGDWVAQEIMAQAKRRGVPVVFALHNFAYQQGGRALPACGRGACPLPVRAGPLPPHAGIDLHTDSGSLGLVAAALPRDPRPVRDVREPAAGKRRVRLCPHRGGAGTAAARYPAAGRRRPGEG